MELNTIMLRGRAGSFVDLKNEVGQRPYAHFRLAVPRSRRKDNGEWEELEPTWYTVKAWGNLARHLDLSVRKGQPVLVVGRPSAQAWINKTGEAAGELAIHATSVGHDLTFGVTEYMRFPAVDAAAGQATEPEGQSVTKPIAPTGPGDLGAREAATPDSAGAVEAIVDLPSADGDSDQAGEGAPF